MLRHVFVVSKPTPKDSDLEVFVDSFKNASDAIVVRAGTGEELQDVIEAVLEKSTIDYLDLVGHGDPGVITIGDHEISADRASLRWLKPLRGQIGRKIRAFRLLGCNVGSSWDNKRSDDEPLRSGPAFLLEVSRFLEGPVHASVCFLLPASQEDLRNITLAKADHRPSSLVAPGFFFESCQDNYPGTLTNSTKENLRSLERELCKADLPFELDFENARQGFLLSASGVKVPCTEGFEVKSFAEYRRVSIVDKQMRQSYCVPLKEEE